MVIKLIYCQWWSVTKYNYFVTVLKYIFQVSVLYWSSFILSNFYFHFTTFQSIRSYFLLHYISENISLLTWYITCSETQKRCLIHEQTDSFQWTCSIGSQIATNDSFTDAMIRLQLFSSRKLTDSNDPFRASLLQGTELTRKEPRDLVSARYWCCEKYVTNVKF